MKISVRIACVPAEIGTGYLLEQKSEVVPLKLTYSPEQTNKPVPLFW
jgi:hypothetical protein